MDEYGKKIVCSKQHDEIDFILERFERQIRTNDLENHLHGLKPHSREKLLLRAKSYGLLASSAFQSKEFNRAKEFLTKAITLIPCPVFFAKRSIVHLMMENYQLAAADGTCAIGLDRTFPSGYFCRALALIHLCDYQMALRDLEKLRECLPNSRNCTQLYVKCRNQFLERGEIEPFDAPQNIAEVPVNEEESVFVPKRINELKAELSISGIIETSKLTEEFVVRVIETYKQGIFHLPLKHVYMVLQHALELFKDHKNVVRVDITERQTLTVVGDLRGNFHNLMCVFNHNQSPQFGRPYLFNGNIIGDYKMSLPCIVIILCMKILFPEDVFINRGSEECLEECENNGFENEVLTVYDEEIMKGFSEVFNWLPVAHVLNSSVLIVHGGIFENKNITLANIQEMKRSYQPPSSGPMCDILHSDPWNYGGISKDGRQKGVWFGPDAAIQFCRRNCLDYIVRSHKTPNALGYEAQSYNHCFTVNSSTQHSTYMKISGKTSVYNIFQGRKQMKIPENCSCWIMCNCRMDKEKQERLMSDYVTQKLDSLLVPSEMSVESSDQSLFRSKSNASRSKSNASRSKSNASGSKSKSNTSRSKSNTSRSKSNTSTSKSNTSRSKSNTSRSKSNTSRVLSYHTPFQQSPSKESMKSHSQGAVGVSNEVSHLSLLALTGKRAVSKSTSILVRGAQSSKSGGSTGFSQQSAGSPRSNRSSIPTESNQTTTEVPQTTEVSINSDQRAPEITESDTIEKPDISTENNETDEYTESSSFRDSTLGSQQTPSFKEQNPPPNTSNPLMARSMTRSEHWLIVDHPSSPTHSVYTTAGHEDDGEDFDFEFQE